MSALTDVFQIDADNTDLSQLRTGFSDTDGDGTGDGCGESPPQGPTSGCLIPGDS